MAHERVLDVFSGQDDCQRLVAVAITDVHPSGETDKELVLRQESKSDAGWFVQSEIAITREQIWGLKAFLTSTSADQLSSGRQSVPVSIIPISGPLQRRA